MYNNQSEADQKFNFQGGKFMKKLKKFVAIATALTMVLTPMTALADVSIGGDVNYVDKEIYKVTLPTSEGMAFTLDPQGLASLDDGGEYDENEAGKINGVGTMTAKNESSVEVTLSAKFYIVDTADTAATLTNSISDETANEIAMAIGTTDATTTSIPVTASTAEAATATTFTMAAATYNFEKTDDGYAYVLEAESGSKVDMTIGGNIAKEADWSAYTGENAATITLHAVFEFTNADNEVITPEEEEEEEEDAQDTFVMTKNDDGTVSYKFINAPEGEITALTVNGATKMGAVTAGNVTYADGTLSFNTTAVSGTGLGNVGTHTVIVTIADVEYSLTYTAE